MSIVLGIDHGNGYVKAKSKYKSIVLPSAFCRSDAFGEDSWDGVGKLDVNIIKSSNYKDEEYAWGRDIDKANNLINTYTSENRYNQKPYQLLSEFIMASLLEPGKHDDIIVVTGCPSEEKGTDQEEALKNVFLGGHIITIDEKDYIFNVSQVVVLPQPLGTILDLYIGEDGYVSDDTYEEDYVGIVDIGSGTTDLDGIKGLKRQSGDKQTINIGMHTCYQQIANYINEQNTSALANRFKVEKQIIHNEEKDSFIISKRASVDIAQIKERVYRETAEDLANQINQIWTTRSKFDKLLLTGGGVDDFGKYFKEEWEKDVILATNSQMANANGFYKHGLNLLASVNS
ncbi:ParM/StbA family protein [Chengkuizengella marina]|uniref:ParM/StbA family protein n=1 Tax=Chengkuizengella marina TaxID=2507566 RepID=UPI00136A62F0|nr:plasmid segregation protein ParM domain-containing protein [Chengkuizengella marina]